MAKVAFTKLGLKLNNEIKTIDFNDQIIEVKQYLPIQDKLELISNVINLSADENNFANPVKISVYTVIEIINKYTNINFTEKQKEDIPKLYDLLSSNGIIDLIKNAIPNNEYHEVFQGIQESIESVYKYKNSVLGILEVIKEDYSDLDLEVASIQEALSNPENVGLLKDILNKIG